MPVIQLFVILAGIVDLVVNRRGVEYARAGIGREKGGNANSKRRESAPTRPKKEPGNEASVPGFPRLPTGLSRRTGYPLDFALRVQSFSIRSHKKKQICAAIASGHTIVSLIFTIP